MIYILLYNYKNSKQNNSEIKFILELQTKILNFLKENFVGKIDKSKYSIIYCNKHIIESTLSHIDKKNDIVLWHPNLGGDNLSILKQYINSIVVLRHKTLLLQKISYRNMINENMAVNHDFKLMYIENDYNDITNSDWKLVSQPKIVTPEEIISKITK